MDDNYENIEKYNPNKKCKILIIFDNMIAVMLSNKKLNPIVTELFILIKLTKKLQIYQYYHQLKLISMNFLQAKKYYIHIEVEQAKFTYSPLGKAFKTFANKKFEG